MIRVLHLAWGLELGGKEQFLSDLVGTIDAQRFSSEIWTLRRRGALYGQLEKDGYTLRHVGKRAGLDPLAMFRLWRQIPECGPDVINVHEFTSAFAVLGVPFARPRVPVVVTLHGGHQDLPLVKRLLHKRVLAGASAVVAVSRHMAEGAEAGTGVGVTCIPYGIDTERFRDSPSAGAQERQGLGLPRDGHVVVMVARMAEPKRHDVVVRAARALREESPDCHIVFVGDGHMRAGLEALTAGLGLSGCVHFAGARTDVPRVIGLADVCVMSSDREGLPISVLEYMAAGRPVVASRVGGLPELVQDGLNGYLVEPGDAQAMASRIGLLLRDPVRRAEMGAQGRLRVERRHTLPVMCKAYEELYESVTAGRPPNRR